ncbi:hypothetical protein SBV1_1020008 [Verrucomicrobia bacterium]|nr:hypothetical protein SBV1_1020008 [Verrucomicrobiota bacterium]
MMFDQDAIKFRKTGTEIKEAMRARCAALRARLDHRNRALDALMGDRKKLRSYLVLSVEHRYNMHEGSGELRGRDDISSEEIEDINQLCKRIREIEAEIYRLELTLAHLEDGKEFSLSLQELVAYGFDVKP